MKKVVIVPVCIAITILALVLGVWIHDSRSIHATIDPQRVALPEWIQESLERLETSAERAVLVNELQKQLEKEAETYGKEYVELEKKYQDPHTGLIPWDDLPEGAKAELQKAGENQSRALDRMIVTDPIIKSARGTKFYQDQKYAEEVCSSAEQEVVLLDQEKSSGYYLAQRLIQILCPQVQSNGKSSG